jgi:hypothetical protein
MSSFDDPEMGYVDGIWVEMELMVETGNRTLSWIFYEVADSAMAICREYATFTNIGRIINDQKLHTA